MGFSVLLKIGTLQYYLLFALQLWAGISQEHCSKYVMTFVIGFTIALSELSIVNITCTEALILNTYVA